MSKIKSPCVYKITNPVGATYVGSTVSLHRRISAYRNANCPNQTKLYHSILKYGWDAHAFEIIWQGNSELMLEMERKFGDQFKVLDRENGLNLNLPGYGEVLMAKSREAIDKFIKSRPWIPLSNEIKSKMIKNRRDIKFTTEARNKSALVTIRSVIQYDKNGEILNEYISTSEAAKVTNIGRTCIKNNLTGLAKSAGGFIWKFKDGITKGPPHKKVIQLDMEGNIIEIHESMAQAGRALNINSTSIRYVVSRGGKTAAGYKWKYA